MIVIEMTLLIMKMWVFWRGIRKRSGDSRRSKLVLDRASDENGTRDKVIVCD